MDASSVWALLETLSFILSLLGIILGFLYIFIGKPEDKK